MFTRTRNPGPADNFATLKTDIHEFWLLKPKNIKTWGKTRHFGYPNPKNGTQTHH